MCIIKQLFYDRNIIKLFEKKRKAKRRSSVFIINFEHVSHLISLLVFLLLTLNMLLGT